MFIIRLQNQAETCRFERKNTFSLGQSKKTKEYKTAFEGDLASLPPLKRSRAVLPPSTRRNVTSHLSQREAA